MIDSSKKLIVKFDEDVIKTFEKYQQKSGEYESGGILIGEIYPSSNKVVVKEAIISVNAMRSFTGVNIDKKEMQKKLDECRKQSNFKYYYLGDWHTHPEKNPKPSWIDRISYWQTCKKAQLMTNFIIFIIIGNGDNIQDELWMDVNYI